MKKKNWIYLAVVAGLVGLLVAVFIPFRKEKNVPISAKSNELKLSEKKNRTSVSRIIKSYKRKKSQDKDIAGTVEGIKKKYNTRFYDNSESKRTELPVPERLRLVCGIEGGRYEERMSEIEKLKGRVNIDDMNLLLRFLHKDPKNDNLPLMQLDAVKNDIATIMLKRQNDIKLVEHLVGCYYDKGLDKIWREYTLQFMGAIYSRATKGKRAILQFVLNDALGEKKKMAGTAILQLKNIVKAGDMKKSELGEKAYELAVSDESSNQVRITALQVVQWCGHDEASAIALKILDSKESSPMLKMSAISVLGKNNAKNKYTEILKKYSKSTDYRLRTAAKYALNGARHQINEE